MHLTVIALYLLHSYMYRSLLNRFSPFKYIAVNYMEPKQCNCNSPISAHSCMYRSPLNRSSPCNYTAVNYMEREQRSCNSLISASQLYV